MRLSCTQLFVCYSAAAAVLKTVGSCQFLLLRFFPLLHTVQSQQRAERCLIQALLTSGCGKKSPSVFLCFLGDDPAVRNGRGIRNELPAFHGNFTRGPETGKCSAQERACDRRRPPLLHLQG